MTRSRIAVLFAVALTTIPLAACGNDDGGRAASASGSASGAPSDKCKVVDGTKAKRDTEVHVDLDEWTISVDEHTVKAGNIEFHTTNKGKEAHELVIVKGAKPDQLTIGDDGLDEKSLPTGAEVLGEIEPFDADQVCVGVFALEAGDYTLLCNIVDKEMHHVHAKEGMVAAFTVT